MIPIDKEPESAPVVPYTGDADAPPIMQFLKESPPQRQTYRGRQNLHVSDLITKCVRKVALMERLGVRHPTEKVADGRGITFAIGDALHAFVTNRITQGHPDKVYASWSCACGHSKEVALFSKVKDKQCAKCGTHLTKHDEVPFVHPQWPVTGSPDLILYMAPSRAYYVTELKSMAAAPWKELVRPLPDHVVQVTFYWHILHALGWPLVDKVSILYVNKELSFKSPYKEFLVDPQAPGILDPYMPDIQAFMAFRGNGPLPPRTFCETQDAVSAKACPVAVSCFGCDQ